MLSFVESLKRPASNPSGFVLLEAVIALTIIAMVSIALLAATSSQIRTADQANELLIQKSLAEDRLAALRILNYEDLEDLPDSVASGVFATPFEEFQWTAVVEVMEDEYDLFGLEIVVTGPNERFPLRALLHRPRAVLGGTSAGQGASGGGTGGAVRGSDRAPQSGGDRGGQVGGAGRGGQNGGGQVRGGTGRGGTNGGGRGGGFQ